MIRAGGVDFLKKFLGSGFLSEKNISARSQKKKNIPAQTHGRYALTRVREEKFWPEWGRKKYLGFENATKNFSGSDNNPHPPDL